VISEKFEDTKGVIRKRNSKGKQYNDQEKKDKTRNNDLQNTRQKTKDQQTRTPLKSGLTQELRMGKPFLHYGRPVVIYISSSSLSYNCEAIIELS